MGKNRIGNERKGKVRKQSEKQRNREMERNRREEKLWEEGMEVRGRDRKVRTQVKVRDEWDGKGRGKNTRWGGEEKGREKARGV